MQVKLEIIRLHKMHMQIGIRRLHSKCMCKPNWKLEDCRRMRIQLNHKEKGRYNQSHAAEREIGFLSERWRRRMAKKSVPRRLWDFGLVYEAELLSRLSRGRDGRTGHEEVFGQTPNIAEYVDFEFYELVWW